MKTSAGVGRGRGGGEREKEYFGGRKGERKMGKNIRINRNLNVP